MPQFMDDNFDNLVITTSGTTLLSTGVLLPPGCKSLNIKPRTNFCQFGWDAVDNVAIATTNLHTVPADTLWSQPQPSTQRSDRKRHAATVYVDTQPSGGELWTLTIGGVPIVFGFTSGGDTQVTIGANVAATATNLAAAINGEATLLCRASVHADDDNRIDILCEAAGAEIGITDGTGNISHELLGDSRIVVYIASVTVSTVVELSTEG